MALSLIQKVYAACDPGQGGIDLSDCLPLNREGDLVAEVYDTPSVLVNLLVRNAFVLGGIFIFILLLYGGFRFIDSSTKGKEQALEIFQIALVGLVVLFASYWVVQIIEIIIGTDLGI